MKVLFLTHRLPYAPNRGDRVRAFHLLRELSKWAEVDLVSLVHDEDEATHAGDLSSVAVSVTTGLVSRRQNLMRAAAALATRIPTTHSLLHAPGLSDSVGRLAADRRPDIVFCYCTGIAPLATLPALRHIPLVLDMVDVDSAKWASLAGASKPPTSWIYAREARVLRRFERQIVSAARITLVVTENEARTLGEIQPNARIEVVGNGVDVDRLRPPDPEAKRNDTVVFCGVMDYPPNVEGVRWFASEVWPSVRRQRPQARMEIVGSNPTSSIRGLDSTEDRIAVTGHVADVRPHLWSASVSVAPLLTARGVQNKVLEALAAGLPAVVTSTVAGGLPTEARQGCVVADTAKSFAAAVVTLIDKSPQERQRMAAEAHMEALAWDRCLMSLRELMQAASGTVA